jgi:hypothetical protein
MLRGVDLGSVIAIRPADVFVQLGSGRLLHWNGSTWTAYPNLYGRGKLAAVGTQLWRIENATVDRRPNRLIVQRWTGSAWRTMTSPHPVVAYVADADLSASSPRNVWVEIMNVRRQDARLLRWNGRVWSELNSPSGWLVNHPGAAAAGTASVWIDAGIALWSDGKWQAADGFCGNVTAVPGTKSSLCAGGDQPGTGPRTYGVILQNGPLR